MGALEVAKGFAKRRVRLQTGPAVGHLARIVERGGVGQGLLEELEKYALDNGFRRLYLYTTYVLPGAKRLYEKNGFYVLRETAPEEWFEM